MTTELDFSLIKYFFHISPEGAEHPSYSLPAASFYDLEQAKQAVEYTGEFVQAIGTKTASSFMGMSFFNLAITKLLIGVLHNRSLDLPIDNLTYQLEKHDDHAHLGYRINEVRSVEIPDGEARTTFIYNEMASYIENTVTPGIEAIAAAGNVKTAMIWTQFGTHALEVRDYVVDYIKHPGLLERFLHDFNILMELPAELFKRSRNPFIHTPRFIDNPWHPEKPLMMKSACCFYDCRVDGDKCYACPRMLPEEREERKKVVLATAAGE
ncbi:hypothetical protein [Paenibacillus sp. 2TAB19]|uniref:hypothetical protein n=1 Tax=Paenibacillus sp. 2TAB19 TaxID=3233003 RepID=UPI003F9E6539